MPDSGLMKLSSMMCKPMTATGHPNQAVLP